MEKFQIDPNEEKRRHDEILKKLDPDLAKILQKHLTYSPSPEQENPRKDEGIPKEPLKKIPNFKTHIELSQQEEEK